MGVSKIVFYGDRTDVQLGPFVSLLKKIGKKGEEIRSLQRRFSDFLDVLISGNLHSNFVTRQHNVWKPINFFTVMFSRSTIMQGVKAHNFDDMKSLASQFSILEDSGRLKKSLLPKRYGGGGDHIFRVRNGRLEIGSSVPWAGDHLAGAIKTFKRDVEWVRPGRKGVPGSGKPLRYGEGNIMMFKWLAPPTRQNNYFSNRLRYKLAMGPKSVSAKLPIRSWLGLSEATKKVLTRFVKEYLMGRKG